MSWSTKELKLKLKEKWEGSSDRTYTDLFKQTNLSKYGGIDHNFNLSQKHTMSTKYLKAILDFF